MTEIALIANGRVVSEHGELDADVHIEGGRVVALTAWGAGPRPAGEVLDASGSYVLPGALDPHVHIAVPGDPNMHPVIEDLEAASRAAVHGGTTTQFAFVRGTNDVSLAQAIDDEVARGLERSSTDFGIHALLYPGENLEEDIPVGIARGVRSFKAMMAYKVRGMMLDDEELFRAMRLVAAVDGLMLIHAENGGATAVLDEFERASGTVDGESYWRTSPGILEAEGMFRAVALAELAGCEILFMHVSAAESADVLRFLKQQGRHHRVHAETQPHYLVLTNDLVAEKGALGKIGPPLKKAADVSAVWEGVRDGLVSHFSSDHNPRTIEMKQAVATIFDAPYGGISGSEVLLPLAWGLGVDQGRLSPAEVVGLTSAHAARLYRMHPQKGALVPGADADAVVIPREAEPRAITADALHGLSDYSIYEGITSTGFPRYVLRAGRLVVADGEVVSQPPGRYLGAQQAYAATTT